MFYVVLIYINMLRPCLIIAGLVLAVWSLSAEQELPDPGDLALLLNEEEFEDYLDQWLEIENQKWTKTLTRNEAVKAGGCNIKVNGDLGEPQPVYLDGDSNYLDPVGNTGQIHLDDDEQVTLSCPGSGRTITHPNIIEKSQTVDVTCVSGTTVSGDGWLDGTAVFGELKCSTHPLPEAEFTDETCWNDNRVIRVGFLVDGEFKHLYSTCFDENRLEAVYAWYEQRPQNSAYQTNVARPSWRADSFYPGININNLYTQATQKRTIAGVLGQELADKYVTSQQYLARGHLAAKTDFIYATGQRATFYFHNSAPQWQAFNAANWNWLEQALRRRVGDAGYHTTIYTGTWGISQLRDENDELVDIHLHYDENNNPQVPVPLYYYKVVYDADLGLGTAFVGINNPYYSEEEVRALAFCTDRCRGNSDFSWLNWQPDRIDYGYSFCCDVDDFRRTVPHLPEFTVDGLLA